MAEESLPRWLSMGYTIAKVMALMATVFVAVYGLVRIHRYTSVVEKTRASLLQGTASRKAMGHEYSLTLFDTGVQRGGLRQYVARLHIKLSNSCENDIELSANRIVTLIGTTSEDPSTKSARWVNSPSHADPQGAMRWDHVAAEWFLCQSRCKEIEANLRTSSRLGSSDKAYCGGGATGTFGPGEDREIDHDYVVFARPDQWLGFMIDISCDLGKKSERDLRLPLQASFALAQRPQHE